MGMTSGELYSAQKKTGKKTVKVVTVLRSRIQIHTFDWWIRIQEAQKNVDPVDPDPQHWL